MRHTPSGLPAAVVGRLAWECTPAVPAAAGSSRLAGRPQWLAGSRPRLGTQHPRYPYHRRPRSRHSLVLLARPATEYRAGRGDRRAHGTVGSGSFWPLGIACAGVVVTYLLGVVGLVGHAPSLTSPLGAVEAEVLPSCRVLLSRRSSVLRPPPTSQVASPWTSARTLYHGFQWMWATDDLRPPLFHRLLSQHSAPPTPRSSSRLRIQTLRLFHGLHLACKARLSFVPYGLTSRRCRVHVLLRTTGLHLLLGGILRFSTPGHPGALGACYVALWRLPRPDLHRLADGDLQGTPRDG